jgi:hypothetical protein
MTPPSKQETSDHSKGRPLSVELAWEVLKELGESEKHFNDLETEYRKLASIWLLAGFAGMGFILKEETQMAIPREVVVMAIGLAASIGIFLLWIVDLLVYHRLLDACFEQAKKIEKLYPELPDVRSAMERTQGGGKVVTTRLRWFYILLSAVPVLFSTPLFFVWCEKEHGSRIEHLAEGAVVLYLIVTTSAILKIPPSARTVASDQ